MVHHCERIDAIIKMTIIMSMEQYGKYNRLVTDERRFKKYPETIITTITVHYSKPGKVICKNDNK